MKFELETTKNNPNWGNISEFTFFFIELDYVGFNLLYLPRPVRDALHLSFFLSSIFDCWMNAMQRIEEDYMWEEIHFSLENISYRDPMNEWIKFWWNQEENGGKALSVSIYHQYYWLSALCTTPTIKSQGHVQPPWTTSYPTILPNYV